MSCFFCSSSLHLSENCDSYVSHESRKEKILSKNHCEKCLNTHYSHLPSSRYYCLPRCYLCFSKCHHTVFCSQPALQTSNFVFAIDNTLMPRFFQMCDPNECLRFTLMNRSTKQYNEFLKEISFIVKNEIELLEIASPKELMHKFSGFLPSCHNIFIARIVKIKYCKISLKDLFMLLSAHIKEFTCWNTKIAGTIEFTDILKQMRNVREVTIYATNVIFDSNWLEKLIKRKDESYLKQLKIHTDKFKYDGEVECRRLTNYYS